MNYVQQLMTAEVSIEHSGVRSSVIINISFVRSQLGMACIILLIPIVHSPMIYQDIKASTRRAMKLSSEDENARWQIGSWLDRLDTV